MPLYPIRVVLVEDQCLVRAGFRQLLESGGEIQVVGEATSAEEALLLLQEIYPAVLILDVSLPGISGVEALGRLRRMRPDLRILMLSMHESDPLPEVALRSGASGYLSKRCAPEELVTAVRQIAAGRQYLSGSIAQRVALERMKSGRSGLNALSPRELEIFTLLGRGHSVKEIALALQLSPKTVHVHRANLLRKLDVRTNADLAQIALRNGLVPMDRPTDS
ncbi:LuxR family transcriptional regulator [Thioalkalivibrio paradoxus ARh 1]|uniref:LuxR family transcriptional regulator n=1 Tax=Thioalkalivibrio paradoxus ARh 1 TaxID=713585 RepID=W0DMS2_9GAMM|nr:LuxR family transcriptional regulator [Thioalkalivibrio paradoxus ARh 1]